MPEKTDEINMESDLLESALDYSGVVVTAMNEKQQAINDSVAIIDAVKEKNEDLTTTIYAATEIIRSGDIPLDESTLSDLQEAVDDGNSATKNTMETLDRTQEPIIDYSSINQFVPHDRAIFGYLPDISTFTRIAPLFSNRTQSGSHVWAFLPKSCHT